VPYVHLCCVNELDTGHHRVCKNILRVTILYVRLNIILRLHCPSYPFALHLDRFPRYKNLHCAASYKWLQRTSFDLSNADSNGENQIIDIWLAVHHSTTFLLLPTWYTNFLFSHINYIKLNYSTCFERNPLIIRRSTTQIIHIQPLVSSLSASDRLVQSLRLHKTVICREWRYQRLHMYNLRRWPPDDERIAL